MVQGILEQTVFQTTQAETVLEVSLLQTVAVDGLVITDNFTRTYSRPAFVNQTQILLTLAFPAFEVELEYDPDVAILLDTKGGSGDSKPNSLMIGLVSAAVFVVCALVLAVGFTASIFLFVWIGRFQIKEYMEHGSSPGSAFRKSIHFTSQDADTQVICLEDLGGGGIEEEEFVELSDSD